jgi:hypothetical protein
MNMGLPPTVSYGGKHIKVEWFVGTHRYVSTVSTTKPDRNWYTRKHARADIRRIFRTHQEQHQ